MQTVDVSKDIDVAVNILEDILNSKDGEDFLQSIREFKLTREIDDFTLLGFRKYMR